jgi:hypothetical protein
MDKQVCLLASVMMLVTAGATAKELILCKSPSSSDIVISIDDRKFSNRSIDCIKGSFVSDMTPCAPPNAYGLSAPTGSAELVGLADRWQDYANHLGGITGHSLTADSIEFSGGFNSGGGGYHELWRFEASRLTGAGKLTAEGRPPIGYNCKRSKGIM